MASQPTTYPDQHSDNNDDNDYEKHPQLYARHPKYKDGAERRHRTSGRAAKVNYLQKKYREEFGLTENDLWFIESLAHLEVQGGFHFSDSADNRISRDYYITEGHRWLVDRFDPDIELLKDLELIQQPYIDSKPRERIIRRRFWDLTSSGRDLVDIDFSGENIGDTGEHVVHRIGMHLVRWWCEEKWGDRELLDIERYPHPEGAEMDLIVWNEGGYQFISGEDVDKHPRQLFEVETGMSDWEDLEGDAHKMAYYRGDSWWVFPMRDVAVKVLDKLTMHGYTGLDRPIPETLAMREHRDTYTKRVQAAEPEMTELNHRPVEHVLTYKNLADDLKEWRPELFYGPRDER